MRDGRIRLRPRVLGSRKGCRDSIQTSTSMYSRYRRRCIFTYILLLWALQDTESFAPVRISRHLPPLLATPRRTNNDDADSNRKKNKRQDHNEERSQSKEKAISALSKPNRRKRNPRSKFNGGNKGSDNKRHFKVKEKEPEKQTSYSSLLPPPLEDSQDESLSSGLSSWEDFLGAKKMKRKDTKDTEPTTASDTQLKLPAIEDLFPPDISSTPVTLQATSNQKPILEGVLPVSDLFYRSGTRKEVEEEIYDDEELPFSSEQSDAVYSDDNRVRIQSREEMSKLANKRKGGGRRMVRRGMEMLVGGVPIHADPPQRSLELTYDDTTDDWASCITLNTGAFGPLLENGVASKVSDFERGLFCEHFTHAAMKWDICPDDLRQIVKAYKLKEARETSVDIESREGMVDEVNFENKRHSEKSHRQAARGFGKKEKSDIVRSVESVFADYTADKASSAPFGGKLGGELLDAVTKRARDRKPQVIAIGDVHGCVDELQALLRESDYRPGDLIVFLGDLVCKGPDSISVVQMAREIGALCVRGNHDFEIIRWHQAIKSGVDPPVVGSEHFHIASCLSNADMKYLFNLPWYISSKELQCLFVHAGFVSGIRLSKQNPRLMLNMRSILPDGTVTSKMYSSWPWARLWDGPQTVLFGHDADRGLQQYEHCIGLDTGCVYGGRLTACILPEKRLVSVSARREYFKYRRKHYD